MVKGALSCFLLMAPMQVNPAVHRTTNACFIALQQHLHKPFELVSSFTNSQKIYNSLKESQCTISISMLLLKYNKYLCDFFGVFFLFMFLFFLLWLFLDSLQLMTTKL